MTLEPIRFRYSTETVVDEPAPQEQEQTKPPRSRRRRKGAESKKPEEAPKEEAPREKNNGPIKKMSYKDQREYDTIGDEIAALEEKIAKADADMAACATDFTRLQELSAENPPAISAGGFPYSPWLPPSRGGSGSLRSAAGRSDPPDPLSPPGTRPSAPAAPWPRCHPGSRPHC